MKLKFNMHPLDEGLLPIYERILSMQGERARARYLRSLLMALCSSHFRELPDWFYSLPQQPFQSSRQVSFRMVLDDDEPILHSLIREMEPMSHGERVLHLKRLLLSACKSDDSNPVLRPREAHSDSPSPNSNRALPTPSLGHGNAQPAETLAVQTDAADEM